MIARIKLLIPFIIILITIACNNMTPVASSGIQAASDSIQPPDTGRAHLFLFGIPSDLYNLASGKIKQNGFFSKILLEHGITMQDLDMVLRNSAAVFDIRKMKSGNNFTLFCDKDSLARARYLVYEHDPSTCYVFSFNDSLNITPFRKEIKKSIKYASVTIETSLWDAMHGDGLPPDLVTGLSEIFAWSVDFFGLQKGDSFKVIYEETSIDDKIMGISRIYGAQYCSPGSTIYAVPFIQDGRESYFDVKGNSLRKEFLKAPLQFSRVTSRFSASRMHPILRIRRPHFGVDYAAPVGTSVHAIGDGRVVSTSFEGGAGRMVKIVHNSVYSTAYLHLSRFGDGITPGAKVKQGDIVGYVGTSGLSTGPHLDFRFYKNGSPVDPLKVEAPPVEPISETNLQKFEKSKKVVTDLLGTF
jgi:murein DD-endopeptidase MepM/ murein hydrolase activator NlpD